MSRRVSKGLFACLAVTHAVCAQAAGLPAVRGVAAVASDEAQASACGTRILSAGGNAVDAAVATALCAGVVQPSASGLGGGGFALLTWPGRVDPILLDFREAAPQAAARDMFRLPDGGVDKAASKLGGQAVAVPSEGIGLAELHARWGELPARAVAAPAVELASRGFVCGWNLATKLADLKPEGSEVIDALGLTGFPLAGGAAQGLVLRRPSLAATLRRWAATGGEDLRTGAGAEALVSYVQAHGGALTLEDLAAYRTVERAPVVGSYRGYTVISAPPPSSSGIAIVEMLGALEAWDIKALGLNSADMLHLLAEVMQHAYADRAHHLGDPAFVDVPMERLLSTTRRDEIRAAVDMARTFPPERYGPLIAPPVDAGTEHISVVDAMGFGVALTTTINLPFGSGLVEPRTGVILNDEMDDFVAAPGVPNAFGLVGTEANAIAPGKRPLSSMSPTILLAPDGHVALVIGGSGGSTIISAVLQAILAVVDFGYDPSQALALPRIHHQWQPAELVVEPELPKDVVAALTARGHKVVVRPAFSAVQAVYAPSVGVVLAGSDPRKGGLPSAVPVDR
jgi:gamma-glutamyltranspeptidase/glutathione hydrolase